MEYHRYGLKENPFEGDVISIGNKDQFESVHLIDEDSLKIHLAVAIEKKRLASFVVTGTSGSGRTAFARHIMTLYMELRAALNFNVAHYERPHDGNVDSRQVSRDILKGLSDKVKRLGANLRDGPVEELREEIRKLKIDYTIQDLQSLATDFAIGVHDLHSTFALSVEDIPNAEVFKGIRLTLDEAEGLLIRTINHEQREAVLGGLKPQEVGYEIRLDNLADDRACELARQRWTKWNAKPPVPFDMDGLKKTFHDKPRTVGKSLKTLAFLIDSKLANHNGNTLHPQDPGLSFDEKQIRLNFERFDKGTR